MPLRYDNNKVIKRLSNGACVMGRVCSECGKDFTGERNMCPQCRNEQRRQSGRFGADYHRNYYRRFLSKSALLHGAGTLSRDPRISGKRRAAFEIQRRRITEQIKRIRQAGLDPDNDTMQKIERVIAI